MHQRTCPVAAVLLLGLLAAACEQEPAILAPADRSQADASGVVAVEVELGQALGAGQYWVQLVSGLDDEAPVVRDLTVAFGLVGTRLSHTLGPADLVPGRHQILVGIDPDGDGFEERILHASFSWEPQIDAASADRCDVLDPRLCLLPFPNDHFTREDPTTDTGRRLAIARESMPVSNFTHTPADPTVWNEADGFSIGSPILVHVPGIDLVQTGAAPITDVPRSLRDPDAPVVVLDAESLERVPVWAELDADAHAPRPEDKVLIIWPGVNFRDGRRYLVALRHLKDAAGAEIAPNRGFQLYRDGIQSYVPAIEARRAHLEDVFERLARAGVERAELYSAWDFTVQSTRSISERLLHMRDEAFASLGGAAPSFAVTQVVDFTPAQDARVAREVFGTFDVPQYLTGDGTSPDARLTRGPDGLPFRNGTYRAFFRCNIPRWVLDPAGGVRAARVSLYGHGLFGSENEVGASHVDAMADEQGFVFCATRWAGMDFTDRIPAAGIPNDISRFPQLSERLHQGQLNQLFLARLLRHPQGFVAHPAFQMAGAGGAPVPVFDHTSVYYDGNSQGGIASGALAALSQDIERFAMGVPGMNYAMLLKRSVDFDPFLSLFNFFYTDPVERELFYPLAEILWEHVESNGHVHHMVSDTYPDTPPKRILLHVAFADHQVSMWTAEVWARTIGARAGLPPVHHPDAEPLWGITPIEYPWPGSALIYWDSGNPPPPLENVPPRGGADTPGLAGCAARRNGDPHECPRRQPEARLQKSLFLMHRGAVVDTCGGLPCLADNPD